MDSLGEIERKQRLLLDAVRSHRGVSLRLHDAKASVLEGVIARGDRRVADVIERAYRLGALFDSWDDQFRFELWDQAFREVGFDPGPCLAELDPEALLPWSHIDVGLMPGFLRREHERALRAKVSPPCTKPLGLLRHPTSSAEAAADPRPLVCHNCGIDCALPELRHKRHDALMRVEALIDSAPSAASDGTNVHSAPSAAGDGTLGHDREPPRGVRYRLRYQKLGPAALLGHLDLIRELPRILRRAAIPVAYSRGFHPKPELSFVTALSVGIPSLDEYVDVRLLEAPEPDELLARLTGASTAGLRFIDAVILDDGARNLAKSIASARYAIALGAHPLVSDGSLEHRVQAWLAQPSLPLSRTIGKSTKLIDVRALVLGLEIDPTSARDAIAEAGIRGGRLCLGAEAVIAPEGSVKPSEIVRSLFEEAEVPWRAVRAEFLTASRQPLSATFRLGSPKA